MKNIIPALLLLVLLAACAPGQTTPTPEVPPARYLYAPQPGDAQRLRGEVALDQVDILVMESYPVQIALILKGGLPTPCHELRVVIGEPDAGKMIDIEVYSVTDPDAVCAQVVEPVEVSIPLGSFPAGHYTVRVNGQEAGEFDS